MRGEERPDAVGCGRLTDRWGDRRRRERRGDRSRFWVVSSGEGAGGDGAEVGGADVQAAGGDGDGAGADGRCGRWNRLGEGEKAEKSAGGGHHKEPRAQQRDVRDSGGGVQGPVDEAKKANERAAAVAAKLKRAIEAYMKGFEADWRDVIRRQRGDADGVHGAEGSEAARMIPVVAYAVERRIATGQPDYWDFATKLELAVLGRDRARRGGSGGRGGCEQPREMGTRVDGTESDVDSGADGEAGRRGGLGGGDREGADGGIGLRGAEAPISLMCHRARGSDEQRATAICGTE